MAIASLAQPNAAMQVSSFGTYGSVVTDIGTVNFSDGQAGLPAGSGFLAEIGLYPLPTTLRAKKT
jgi:hypothetical protein